jgi:predicted ATP-grasp superfamily ATP-dependent carboligase
VAVSTPAALVLDGNQRSALAATRALGRGGVHVVVAGEARRTLAGVSRYCADRFAYPSPLEHPEAFVAAVEREAARREIRIILPMTDASTLQLLRARERLRAFTIPVGARESYETLSDKWRLYQLARDLGIPCPRTCLVEGAREAAAVGRELGFPLVVKPRRSVMSWNGRWGATSVAYATSAADLEARVERTPYLSAGPFLLQQYVAGEGRGVFALYGHGRPIAAFAHRRLREKPPSGGVSVLSESVELDPWQRKYTEALLDLVGWHGVAMAEFKIARDGTPYLIEVNARFWGSLQLAVDAGVDFPGLVYRLARGEIPEPVPPYRVGIRSRWLLGDLDRLYLTLRSRGVGPGAPAARWRALAEFLRFREPGLRYDVNRWDDLRPFGFELAGYLR